MLTVKGEERPDEQPGLQMNMGVRTIQQQHFIPADKGLITNTPATLIKDGGFQDANNVRFANGFVEKVKGFSKVASLTGRIMAINLMTKATGGKTNIVHTNNNVYTITPNNPDGISIMEDAYAISDHSYIDYVTFFDNYIFTNIENDIYAWDGKEQYAHKLPGTYSPPTWTAGTAFNAGDVVKPTGPKYSGYIYKCTTAGTSGTEEPPWGASGVTVLDGQVSWIACGGLEIEGNSAESLRAHCIENYKGFLFVANTEEGGTAYPQRLRWSQWQNHTLWHNNSDGSGMAGYVDCSDTRGGIQAIRPLGDYLYVYKEDSIIVLSYSGGDTTFSKDTVTTEAGLYAPQAIVELPHNHIFVGENNIYSFDGSSLSAIGEPIKKFFFDNLSPSKVSKIYGYYDKNNSDVIFAFYSTLNKNTTSPDKAIIFNINTSTWSKRDLKMSALGEYSQTETKTIDDIKIAIDTDNSLIDSSLFKQDKLLTAAGDNEGNLYIMTGYSDSRGDYEGYVTTKTHHMEDPGHIKRLMRIQFHIETQGDYPLVVQIGTSWNAETRFTWSKELKMDLSSPKPPFVDVDLSARYFVIRFGTLKNNQPFRIIGYTIYYQPRGDE